MIYCTINNTLKPFSIHAVKDDIKGYLKGKVQGQFN